MTEQEQIEIWKSKAEKWDKLGEQIARCYPDEYDPQPDDIEDADLGTIGEFAAIAFGYL